MTTMKEIMTAAAQGSYAEIDGVGLVMEQMFRDWAELSAMHGTFLRKYGHIVQRAQAAQGQASPPAPPQPQSAQHIPNGPTHYAPPPHAGHQPPPPPPNSGLYDADRWPLSEPTPDEAARLEDSLRRLARKLSPTVNGNAR